MCYEKIALPARHFYYITSRVHEMYKPTAMKGQQGLIANYVLVDVRKPSQPLASFKTNYTLCFTILIEKFNLNFSRSSLEIHVNHLHPQPSLLVIFIINFFLVNYYFQVSFSF